jgi:hypothetical protein
VMSASPGYCRGREARWAAAREAIASEPLSRRRLTQHRLALPAPSDPDTTTRSFAQPWRRRTRPHRRLLRVRAREGPRMTYTNRVGQTEILPSHWLVTPPATPVPLDR